MDNLQAQNIKKISSVQTRINFFENYSDLEIQNNILFREFQNIVNGKNAG